MSIKKNLGGDRINVEGKMEVEMHEYARSTHNQSKVWKSSMAAGTVVPFLHEWGMTGTSFEIDLFVDVKTLPTVGPLFGSYKVALEVYTIPIRLYQALLNNDELEIGFDMAKVKLPVITLQATELPDGQDQMIRDIDNIQINPSCILKYQGISGIGQYDAGGLADGRRSFNAIALLGYWDIMKNYKCNKQEKVGYVIHSVPLERTDNIIEVVIKSSAGDAVLPQEPTTGTIGWSWLAVMRVQYTTGMDFNQLMVTDINGDRWQVTSIADMDGNDGGMATFKLKREFMEIMILQNWGYQDPRDTVTTEVRLEQFELKNIDRMRRLILRHADDDVAFDITNQNITPYSLLLQESGEGFTALMQTQEGLGVKTYLSDLNNNWINSETITGSNGINEMTKVRIEDDAFTVDAMLLARKFYDYLNRVAASGGSYKDWMDVTYKEAGYNRIVSPVYVGGLIQELEFDEVISNSESPSGQPLGSLAGRGFTNRDRKGGNINIHLSEPSIIIGTVDITPRPDYSQGNKWWVNVKTMDDWHKPAMDQIGWQDMITEERAWWETEQNQATGQWVQRSMGKQPSWINYMTNVNETYGNFADKNMEMFMTLNRRYTAMFIGESWRAADLTSYVDPAKFNFIFAQTSRDSQNFWVQIGVKNYSRRIMSAKQIPNL